jgi:hypothetical protein
MIRLSKHTVDEMDGRRISLAFIEAAAAAPDGFSIDPTDPMLTRSHKTIAAFGGRVQRVAHRPHGADIFGIMARWDTGAER